MKILQELLHDPRRARALTPSLKRSVAAARCRAIRGGEPPWPELPDEQRRGEPRDRIEEMDRCVGDHALRQPVVAADATEGARDVAPGRLAGVQGLGAGACGRCHGEHSTSGASRAERGARILVGLWCRNY